MVVKVCVNGFGTIGRRVADAVNLQSDMKVSGVVKTKPDYKAQIALQKGIKVYAATAEGVKDFENYNLKISGTLTDLLKDSDIVVDTTPGGVGQKNKEVYMGRGLPALFEGGEKAAVADVSFVAQCNFDEAVGAKYIRCVSCNTTGLCRTLHALDNAFGVKRARVTLIRRAADPDDVKRGPIDAIVPDPTTLPSHHGPDVNTVLKDMPITTVAFKVPTTYMHIHAISATLKNPSTRDDVVNAFDGTTRVMLVSKGDGIASTAHLFDYARDLNRPRADLFEICIWRESVAMVEDEVYYIQAVHQEADVIPENVDAVRASLKLMGVEESIKATNASLNIK